MDFQISSGVIPTNRSSKYDDVMTALKGLGEGQHLQIDCKDEEEAENTSNAIRSSAKNRGMKLNVSKRAGTLYIKVTK